ncbi:MAG: hypothetical protein H6618_06345 [Deltaproteobacteria bacterium]|nr:hypothetical protein [Deltaproteobacteria bacterium]
MITYSRKVLDSYFTKIDLEARFAVATCQKLPNRKQREMLIDKMIARNISPEHVEKSLIAIENNFPLSIPQNGYKQHYMTRLTEDLDGIAKSLRDVISGQIRQQGRLAVINEYTRNQPVKYKDFLKWLTGKDYNDQQALCWADPQERARAMEEEYLRLASEKAAARKAEEEEAARIAAEKAAEAEEAEPLPAEDMIPEDLSDAEPDFAELAQLSVTFEARSEDSQDAAAVETAAPVQEETAAVSESAGTEELREVQDSSAQEDAAVMTESMSIEEAGEIQQNSAQEETAAETETSGGQAAAQESNSSMAQHRDGTTGSMAQHVAQQLLRKSNPAAQQRNNETAQQAQTPGTSTEVAKIRSVIDDIRRRAMVKLCTNHHASLKLCQALRDVEALSWKAGLEEQKRLLDALETILSRFKANKITARSVIYFLTISAA